MKLKDQDFSIKSFAKY